MPATSNYIAHTAWHPSRPLCLLSAELQAAHEGMNYQPFAKDAVSSRGYQLTRLMLLLCRVCSCSCWCKDHYCGASATACAPKAATSSSERAHSQEGLGGCLGPVRRQSLLRDNTWRHLQGCHVAWHAVHPAPQLRQKQRVVLQLHPRHCPCATPWRRPYCTRVCTSTLCTVPFSPKPKGCTTATAAAACTID